MSLYAFSIFSLAINLINLDGYKLSGDEVISLNISTGFGWLYAGERNYQAIPIHKDIFYPKDYWERNTMSNVIKYINEDDSGKGIIYETALHLWFKVFGDSIFNGRLLSIIFSVFTLLFLFLIIRILFSDIAVANLACFLLAIHPLFLHYSHEIRPYSIHFVLLRSASIYF